MVLVAFTLTRPLADAAISPTGFDFPGQQSAPGGTSFFGGTFIFAAIAVLGLAFVDQRIADARSSTSRVPGLLAVSAVSAWLTLILGAAFRIVVDVDQLVVVSLVVPLAWLVGRSLLAPPAGVDRVLLVGSGKIAAHVNDLCRRNPRCGMEVIGAVDNDPPLREAGSPPVLGSLDDLGRLLGEGRADRVIVCFSHAGDGQIAEVLRACDEHDVELEMVPRMFDLVGPTQRSRSVGGFPLVSLSGGGPRKGQAIAKRTFDVLFASGFLLVALPLMAIIGLAIVLDSRGAVFYRSNRLGRAGRPFQMLKFRTMVEGADRVESKAVAGLIAGELKREDDPRITRVGRLLRRASLDELPQLLNVVGGSMSVVGPRPVLATEAAGIEGWASRRHNVRPGITGLWQVLGRSTIPWAERMQLDYSYARHWSLVSDLSILARTVSAILSRRGAF